VIQVERRDEVQRFLKARGIASGVYYPQPIHALDACRRYEAMGDGYPIAELCARHGLAIPLFPELAAADARAIAAAVKEAVAMLRLART
jgi:dTDP-4-amino-4,6-dideoxygalactose transaminase